MEYQNRSAQATSTVDAGLRDYMLRVYNFMAGGLGITGLVAYMLFQSTTVIDASGQLYLTNLGMTLFQGPMRFSPLSSNTIVLELDSATTFKFILKATMIIKLLKPKCSK